MVEKVPIYAEKQLVFIPDEQECFLPAEVTEGFERGAKGSVRLIGWGNTDKNLKPDETAFVERMDPQSYKDVDDMITLKLLNDASLLHNLRLRYKNEKEMKIYTNIGSILVSINPYQELGLYNADQEMKYLESAGSLAEMPPHIFKVAETAFHTMRHEDKDQSCVITGESGAGKTEATKRFLQYIAEKSRRNRENFGAESGIDSQLLRTQILDSNPFMEAFGNAKTLRNDNSSRFGKLIEMYFETGKGVVIGAKITNYLLEKSRVVKVQSGERNYHIFYQLCDAACNSHPEFKKKYHLQSADMFNYTLGGNAKLNELRLPDTNDAMVFEETCEAMKKLKLTEEDLQVVWRICAGILHFGNVEFGGTDFAEVNQSIRETSLMIAADLLGVDPQRLEKGLIKRKLTNNVEKHHSKMEAEAARDALAKHLYNKMFDWLISKMNTALSQQMNNSKASPTANIRVLGVLDIFGFETFEMNSFEQLCINFCNEKLQAFFNDHVFKREQKIYQEEGIDAATVGFYDNQGVVDTIESGKVAIMTICDDQCWLESASDDNFLKLVLQNSKTMKEAGADTHYLFKPKIQDVRKNPALKDAFVIKHFAGMVHYNVEGFLEKNKDQLRLDLRKLVSHSQVPLLASFFPNDGEGQAGRQAQFRKTLGAKFKDSLNSLMDKLNHTTPQFVRTIKPNEEKMPGYFESQKIFRQLREAGLLEVCKIRKMGYPIRKTHRQFMNDYLCLDKSAKDVHDLCAKLKAKGVLHGKKSPNWQVGKTKVFMRAEQADELEHMRSEALQGVLKIIHDAVRRFMFRSRIKKALEAIKLIKAGMKSRDAETLLKGLTFFLEKGGPYEKLPIVQRGLDMMKELKIQIEVIDALKTAMERKDLSTIKVKIELAQSLGMGDHEVVRKAEDMLEKLETEKSVKQKLDAAIGSQDIEQLTEAVDYAKQNGFGEIHQCRMAENLLKTLVEREKLLKSLKKALELEDNVDEITDLVSRLRDLGCPDDHPLIIKAIRKCELLIEQDKKRKQRITTLEKQLNKNIEKKDLKKLRDLVNAAIGLKYTGPLIGKAVEMIQALEQRNELIEEVVKAARVLREKSKLPDGIKEADLIPLRHAIKQAESVESLELGKETQVVEGVKLISQMQEQIVVQESISGALAKATDGSLYEVLEKIQKLGLQTREADVVCQRVREREMLKAKADALTNEQRANQLRDDLRVPTEEERQKHLLLRIDHMYESDFRKRAKDASKNRDLAMSKYYKVRADADFVSREPAEFKKERANFKHAYVPYYPLTKSLIEMDDMQERKAIKISQEMMKFCDDLAGNKKEAMMGCMSFIVELGLSDVVLADEIYIQLAKHLTANPNAISKNKAWYLMCLCTTYFGCSKMFEPYLLHFLQNSVHDAGLEGNYARYALAELSSSMSLDAAQIEPRYKPGTVELKSFFERPPVLAQLELVDGTVEDIPIPPDYRLNDCAAIIRRRTKIMITLEMPEWAIYLRATARPQKIGYKQRLENFYRRYKPENLGNVDSILKYHEGNEEALFAELVEISNYGPEPTPVLVGPKKKNRSNMSQSSRTISRKSRSASAYDDLLEDDAQSQFSSGSKSSIGSRISRVGSTISRMFKRARGLSTVGVEDLDVPNPTIAWPIPWWSHLGDAMHSLYEQDKIPVLTYKRRYCKMRGKPDENLYLQLQRDFLNGTLVPFTEGENARLSAMILAVRLLKTGKDVPYGDRARLIKAGLYKCIPKTLKREHKRNEDWFDAYADVAAEKSNDLREFSDVKKLEKKFFEECVQFPTYGMSFFFAQVLKGNVKSYFAKVSTDDADGAVKIGINQNEVAFFHGGKKHESYLIEEIQKYFCDGTTFTMKIKKNKRRKTLLNNGNSENQIYDMALGGSGNLMPSKSTRLAHKSMGGSGFNTLKSTAGNLKDAVSSMFGLRTETIQLYTLQPREITDLIYFFKKQGNKA